MTLLILPSSSLREIVGEASRERPSVAVSPLTYGASRRMNACGLCGTALAEHFDDTNVFVPCAELEVCVCCGHGMFPDELRVMCRACESGMVGSLGEA